MRKKNVFSLILARHPYLNRSLSGRFDTHNLETRTKAHIHRELADIRSTLTTIQRHSSASIGATSAERWQYNFVQVLAAIPLPVLVNRRLNIASQDLAAILLPVLIKLRKKLVRCLQFARITFSLKF